MKKRLGGGNSIFIGSCSSISNCSIFFKGSKNVLRILDGVNLHNMTLTFEDDNNLIEIGSRTTVENNVEICACESRFVKIGNHCMLSHDISIRTSDSYSIFKIGGERLNNAKDVIIGNNVWIGCQSLILKGTIIPDGCIIGARAIVTQGLKANKNSLIVGLPAKIVSEGVYWTRERRYN